MQKSNGMNVIDVSSKISTALSEIVLRLYSLELGSVEVTHPDSSEHGDFTTNVCFLVAKQVNQSPKSIAEAIVYELLSSEFVIETENGQANLFDSIVFAAPGYINFTLSGIAMVTLNVNLTPTSAPKNFMVEYTDPNIFKVFHIGHLMTNAIGESLSRILEASGHEVKRANYQGDVGVHISKSIWGMLQLFDQENLDIKKLESLTLDERIKFLGKSYAYGATQYESDPEIKKIVDNLNIQIYKVSQNLALAEGRLKDRILNFDTKLTGELISDEALLNIYKLGRQWSLEYFETLYSRLNTKFDYYFFESEVGEYGYKFVYDNMSIFEKSDGAIIYRGEQDGLHTRVFINSYGLPVYEAKDLGLAKVKYDKYSYDESIIVTASEVDTYFQVVLSALFKINPQLAKSTTHIGHGMMKNVDGSKFASRTGDVVPAVDLINSVSSVVLSKMDSDSFGEKSTDVIADKIAVAAIKYFILKQSIGNDILFDAEASVSLTGNTGTYLLYSLSRANSLLEKGAYQHTKFSAGLPNLLPEESELLRTLVNFPEVVAKSAAELAPHVVAHYANSLAQLFNTFYANVPVLDAETEEKNFRLYLVQTFHTVMAKCVDLLGMPIVNRM